MTIRGILAHLAGHPHLTVHQTGHHVGTDNAIRIIQGRVAAHIQAAVIVDARVTAVASAVLDGHSASGQVHIPIGIQAVELAADGNGAAGDVDGIGQLTGVQIVAVGGVDSVVGGLHTYIATVNVHHSAFHAFIALGYGYGGAGGFVLAAHGQDAVSVERVVRRADVDGAAGNGQVIVHIDAVISGGDVNGQIFAVDHQAGVVPGLDAVLGVAVHG